MPNLCFFHQMEALGSSAVGCSVETRGEWVCRGESPNFFEDNNLQPAVRGRHAECFFFLSFSFAVFQHQIPFECVYLFGIGISIAADIFIKCEIAFHQRTTRKGEQHNGGQLPAAVWWILSCQQSFHGKNQSRKLFDCVPSLCRCNRRIHYGQSLSEGWVSLPHQDY